MTRIIAIGPSSSIPGQLAAYQRLGAWLNGPPISVNKGGRHEDLTTANRLEFNGGRIALTPAANSELVTP